MNEIEEVTVTIKNDMTRFDFLEMFDGSYAFWATDKSLSAIADVIKGKRKQCAVYECDHEKFEGIFTYENLVREWAIAAAGRHMTPLELYNSAELDMYGTDEIIQYAIMGEVRFG